LAVALGVVLTLGLLTVGVGIGYQLSTGTRTVVPIQAITEVLGKQETFPLQNEILQKLKSGFYREVEVKSLEESAVAGMLTGLDDPYTSYLSPDDYTAYRQHIGGSYSGVGMSVEMKGKFVTVVTVFPDSPAEKAGVRADDAIIEVDGGSVAGMSLEQVVARIKGPEDTSVKIKLFRADDPDTALALPGADSDHLPSAGQVQELTIERRSIEVPVVIARIEEAGDRKVQYLHFLQFTGGSSETLREEVEKAVEQEGIDTIVLDLRGNSGGFLEEAVSVASIFIAEGPIVTTEGLHSPKQVFEAQGGVVGDPRVYLLIDRFSASASEIVAGALKDTKRATLVGETTFGKGLVQTVEPLSNGGALKLTTSVYFTPAGTDINDKGIDPHVVAPDDEATPEVDETLQKALALAARPAA